VLCVSWADEEIALLPEGALFHPRNSTLFIADPHFGKGASFRAAGVPVPGGMTRHDLERLGRALLATGAERLAILGDFLHARSGRAEGTLSELERWRGAHQNLEIVLVRGNHDRSAGDPPPEWRFTCVDEPFVQSPFTLRHDATCGGDGFTLSGHVHPCVVLYDDDGSTMRARCFHLSSAGMTLPAFGRFTGARPVRPRRGDRVFVVGGGSVIEVPAEGCGREVRL
jgi:DNA ligase-associated metallophosphoesterase